ncbi:MAG: hypothetical protein ACTSQX_06295 [Candidatus Heimdallarchaeota archaeon]
MTASRYRKTLFFSLFMIMALSLQFSTSNQHKTSLTALLEEQQPGMTFSPNIVTQIDDLNLNIEFIGYDQTYINETYIANTVDLEFTHTPSIPSTELEFDINFNYRSEANRSALEEHIKSIAINGTDTGYEIDLELLQEDLLSGNRSNIFVPRDGMSIDAESVEEYLYQNFFEDAQGSEPGYTLFLMNYSNLDSLDHELEHWYDVEGIGMDSNETIDYWYSSYTNISKRAAQGWGGKYRFCYLDLSARAWYLDYVKTAWTSLGPGSQFYLTYPDLDNLTQTFDIETGPGYNMLNYYITQWINSYVGKVFSGPIYDNPPLGTTYSLQVLVLNNLTDNGYPEEDLNWVISANRIKDQLENDMFWLDWNVEIVWVELTDHPDLFDYIQDNVHNGINGRYIEVMGGSTPLFYILQNQLSTNFDMHAADVVLPCYFFLTDDIAFTYYGTSFAGLGGMGWEILLGTQFSLFDNGTIGEPRRGYSRVMIHELGHSLGLPHPHDGSYGWGASYIAEVMSYFAINAGFSQFYIDGVARTHANYHFYQAEIEYADAIDLFAQLGAPSHVEELLDEIDQLLDTVPGLYAQMDYSGAANASIVARNLLIEFGIEITNTTVANNIALIAGILLPTLITLVIGNLWKKRKK